MIWRLAKDLDLPEFWPYGRLKGRKIENEALKNNVLSSLRPMDENPRRHEQVYSLPEMETFYLPWIMILWYFVCIYNFVVAKEILSLGISASVLLQEISAVMLSK